MNTISRPEPDDSALQRTAVALGEASAAEASASPAEQAEIEATRALAHDLRRAYAKAPLPFVNPAAIIQRATGESRAQAGSARRRGAGPFAGAITGRRTQVFPWSAFVAVATAACFALALVSFNHAPSTPASPPVVASNSKPVGAVSVSLPGRLPSSSALASGMPGLADAGEALRPAGRASLALSAPNAKMYAEAVRRELAAGRPVSASRLRVDALVNAFVSGRAYAGVIDHPVRLDAVMVTAPWDASRRVLRVTVRGLGREGEVVASRLAASVEFDAASVRGWRIIGHNGATALRGGGSLLGGDAVTTLFEIEPAAGASPSASCAMICMDFRASGRVGNLTETVRSDAVVDFAASDPDTRFAVGLAAYVRNPGEASAAMLASTAGEDAVRRDFVTMLVR